MNGPRPPILFSGHARSTHSLWLRLLLISLVAQVLLPVQTHSRWERDAAGRLVEMCTLQGVQTVRLDGDQDAASAVGTEHGPSPAMAFSALLSHAISATPVLPAVGGHYVVLPDAASPLPVHFDPHLRDAAIRGPPGPLT